MENPNLEGSVVKKEPSTNELKQRLEDAGIDASLWGTGQAKSIEHLQKEIDDGETVLEKNNEGILVRKVAVGNVDIYYVSPDGKKYRLKEDRQVFKDGRERKRDRDGSIFEKMKPDENPTEAMARGIKEELGIEGEINLTETETREEMEHSPSYPGLQTQYVIYKFETTINHEQFRKEGYVEEQKDKSTYFVWEEVDK